MTRRFPRLSVLCLICLCSLLCAGAQAATDNALPANEIWLLVDAGLMSEHEAWSILDARLAPPTKATHATGNLSGTDLGSSRIKNLSGTDLGSSR